MFAKQVNLRQTHCQENIISLIPEKIFSFQSHQNKTSSVLFGDRNRLQFLSNIRRLGNTLECQHKDQLSRSIDDVKNNKFQYQVLKTKQQLNESSPNLPQSDKITKIKQKSDENQHKAAQREHQLLFCYEQTIVESYSSSSNYSQSNLDTVTFDHPQQTINFSQTNYLNFAKNEISISDFNEDQEQSQNCQFIDFYAMNFPMIQNISQIPTHHLSGNDQKHLKTLEISKITDEQYKNQKNHENLSKQVSSQKSLLNLCYCDDLLCFFNRYQRPRPYSQRLSPPNHKQLHQKKDIIYSLSSASVSRSVQEQEYQSEQKDQNQEQEQNQQNYSGWLYKKMNKLHISDYITQTKIVINPRTHKNKIKQERIEKTELRVSLKEDVEEDLSDLGSEKEQLQNFIQQIRID